MKKQETEVGKKYHLEQKDNFIAFDCFIYGYTSGRWTLINAKRLCEVKTISGLLGEQSKSLIWK